uniref:Uncharacterized protein n=1 Tax=Rhabditophanes sp. KR3021 TaxID=114890 RepID=A0AC35UIA2_9BILA
MAFANTLKRIKSFLGNSSADQKQGQLSTNTEKREPMSIAKLLEQIGAKGQLVINQRKSRTDEIPFIFTKRSYSRLYIQTLRDKKRILDQLHNRSNPLPKIDEIKGF